MDPAPLLALALDPARILTHRGSAFADGFSLEALAAKAELHRNYIGMLFGRSVRIRRIHLPPVFSRTPL